MGFCIGLVFNGKNLVHLLVTSSLANTNLNLIQSTYGKSLVAIESLVFLFHLISDDVIVY